MRIFIEILLLIFLLGILIRNLSPTPPTSPINLSAEIAKLTPGPIARPYKIVKVAKNDTLGKILQREGIDAKTTALLLAGKDAAQLKKLSTNQELRLMIVTDPHTQKKILTELQLKLSATTTLIYKKVADKYQFTKQEIPLISKTHYGKIVMQTTLAEAVQKAGLPKSLTSKLTNIFSWKVNFTRDIRPGDKIIVKYVALYDGNKLVDLDKIIAAQIRTRTVNYNAILFQDKSGKESYYGSDGKGLSPAFLRWPILRGRISSSFSTGRTHPILGVVRAHKGTDFAAPYGTPVRATGDGVITVIGTESGYGRTIMLNHGSGYTTLYAHLSRFASNLRVGSRVKQNQTIAYIGTSGLSTGPHVHYEFHVNGVPKDPMKVKLPGSLALSAADLKKFLPFAQQQIIELEQEANK